MKNKLQQIKAAALAELATQDADIEQIRVRFLGKKGELTAVLRGMGALSAEERPVIGQMANEVRAEIEAAITEKQQQQKQKELANRADSIFGLALKNANSGRFPLTFTPYVKD